MRQLVESGKISIRLFDNLHAKIHIGDSHAILGSSNFSRSGLKGQKEANIRVEASERDYPAFREIAEYCFEQGRDFSGGLCSLLDRLLRPVTWQEALGRAVAEMIEGKWLERYPELHKALSSIRIWPSQRQAIGQALYILDHHGGLLIADPTGSGKTRTGAGVHLAIMNRLWSTGRGERSQTLVLSPPLVRQNWQSEYAEITKFAPMTISHGLLRQNTRFLKQNENVGRILSQANILFIDEAHKFINRHTQRSRTIETNTADYAVLFTATPINRRIDDLFRIIELLGIDNLSDDAIKTYETLQKDRKRRILTAADIGPLQDWIRDFTIRRTKSDLNALIDEEPDHYRNRQGKECRYPRQNCMTYPLNETVHDVELAGKINGLAERLRGITRLRRIVLKPEERVNPQVEVKALKRRINAARALAQYQVQAMLRSSRAALIEHIEGTASAASQFAVDVKGKHPTGDVVGTIRSHQDKPIKHNVSVELPDWLTDEGKYRQVCQEEIELYRKISELAKRMSDSRERAKADLLSRLLARHDLVLAFDSRPISLAVIEKNIHDMGGTPIRTIVVTGTSGQKHHLQRQFGLDSEAKRTVGLCSDSMSEGVNLQRASALVLLDMPSVMRIAEQRIGRIDRMDSPFEEIEIYWPEDHGEFALKTDLKFFQTASDVKAVLGSNIDIPEELLEDTRFEKITGTRASELFTRLQKDQSDARFEDGIQDAFRSVRDLVFGPEPLLPRKTYNMIKASDASLMSAIGAVGAKTSWGFFSIRGSERHAPSWIFVEPDGNVLQDLNKICGRLRIELDQAQDRDITNAAVQDLLSRFLKTLAQREIENLPHKRRRALQLLTHIIDFYRRGKDIPAKRRESLQSISTILTDSSDREYTIDYYEYAQRCLDVLQNHLIALKKLQPKKAIHLRHLFRYLREAQLSDDDLALLAQDPPVIANIGMRISSCIIGVGHGET